MVKLIILDLYGTLIHADNRDGTVRPGLSDFLEHYNSSKKIIFSDAPPDVVREDLKQAGLIEKFDAIYDSRYCVNENCFKIRDTKLKQIVFGLGGGNIKNLRAACKDFSVRKSNAVFIGDNFYGRDYKAARIADIKFIKVPQFRSQLPSFMEMEHMGAYTDYESPEELAKLFSFASLIGKL